MLAAIEAGPASVSLQRAVMRARLLTRTIARFEGVTLDARAV